MVKNPRTPASNGGLLPVNLPEPAAVVAKDGLPESVLVRGTLRPVAIVHDRWRIDDEWWRPSPIRREYFDLELEGGMRLTLFRDQIADHWYRQQYTPPIRVDVA